MRRGAAKPWAPLVWKRGRAGTSRPRGHRLPPLPCLSLTGRRKKKIKSAFWSTDRQPNPGLVQVSLSSLALPWWPCASGTSFGKPLLWHSGLEQHQGLYLPGFCRSWSADLGTESPDTFTGQTVHQSHDAAHSGAWPSLALRGCFAGPSFSSGHCQPAGYGSAESRLPVCDCWLVAAVAEAIRDIKKCELPLGPEDTIKAVPRNTLQRAVV